MVIVVAAIGWLLFLVTGVLYLKGTIESVNETSALALQCLALALSDPFRERSREQCLETIEQHCTDLDPDEAALKMSRLVTDVAKSSEGGCALLVTKKIAEISHQARPAN